SDERSLATYPLFEEDRGSQKERVFEEGEAALNAVLVFVDGDELLIGELRTVEDIGRHDETGRPPDRLRQLLFIHRTARRDGDLVVGGDSARTGSAALSVARLAAHLGWLQLEPGGPRLRLLRQSLPRIGFAGKRAMAQMPQTLAPVFLRFA